MKTIITVSIISALAFFILAGCHDENPPVTSGITGIVTDQSDCKLFQATNFKFTEADTFSCVHYLYDESTHKLVMTHINAGFNCCPEEIYCEIITHNDTIIIEEFENRQDCNCLCLFDLDIELQGIAEGAYIVKFIEPYAGNEEKLIFEMDLTSGIEGEYCVVRKGGPWVF